MNKSKASLLNALTALIQMAVTSVLGLVLSRSILSHFGSDHNGINSTVNQIVSTLMVLEGGFTLASNVALFEPYSRRDYDSVNGILSATKARFRTLGLVAFVIGLLLAMVYPFLVTSTMSFGQIVALMLTVLVPACFNLGFSMRYRVLLLVEQKEYILTIISAITYILGNCIAIIMIGTGAGLVVARCVIAASLMLQYILIAMYCKVRYPFARFDMPPAYDKIKGTRNVIALKMTSVIYTSFPIIIISTLPGDGTILASVYAVYKSVITVVRNTLVSVINAPRLSFGALFAEGRDEEAKARFFDYELIACMLLSVILGTTALLIMPFVGVYTRSVMDADYMDVPLAAIMVVTTFVELLHIPSGQIIQMKGDFAASKKIQTVACVVVVVALMLGRAIRSFYAIVIAISLAALVLCVAEIGYAGKKIFQRSLKSFLKNVLPAAVICTVASFIGFGGYIQCKSYLLFFLYGCAAVIGICAITFCTYYFVDAKSVGALLTMIKRMLPRKKHKEDLK